ncbi:MAG: ribonuclease P protein component [Deltaproteobacteria bacterium]|nr:ribonuclease P protein component [Deltaproteobacteria bacterium]
MRRRADFLLCYDSGRRHFTKRFVLFVREREDGGAWRLGLAVTRKSGCVVVRIRVKGVVREFFWLIQERLAQVVDIVVVPKRTLNPSELSLAVAGQEFLPLLPVIAR